MPERPGPQEEDQNWQRPAIIGADAGLGPIQGEPGADAAYRERKKQEAILGAQMLDAAARTHAQQSPDGQPEQPAMPQPQPREDMITEVPEHLRPTSDN